jgi:hypothetical protein
MMAAGAIWLSDGCSVAYSTANGHPGLTFLTGKSKLCTPNVIPGEPHVRGSRDRAQAFQG